MCHPLRSVRLKIKNFFSSFYLKRKPLSYDTTTSLYNRVKFESTPYAYLISENSKALTTKSSPSKIQGFENTYRQLAAESPEIGKSSTRAACGIGGLDDCVAYPQVAGACPLIPLDVPLFFFSGRGGSRSITGVVML